MSCNGHPKQYVHTLRGTHRFKHGRGVGGGAVIRREGAYCIFIDEPLASETLGVVLVRGKRRKNSFMTYDNQISFSKFKYFFIYLPVFSGNV